MDRNVDRFADAGALAEHLSDWATATGPLYRKLADALAAAIRAGALRRQDRLPSERDLAGALAVSRATVVAAYDQLRAEDLVESTRGSGTRVCATVRPQAAADGRVPGGRATSIFQRMVDGPGELISLAFAGEPAADEVAEALADLVHHDLPALIDNTGYHPSGFPPLREAIADHMSRHGLPTALDQVLVTTGAQQAIGLIGQMYLKPSNTVVVESPSWPGCLDVFRAAGATLVGVELDEEGIRPDGTSRAFAEHRPALAYVMPTYHNPTGVLMSADRRRQLAELATRFEVPIVEDNAYAAFATAAGTPSPPPVAAYATSAAEILTIGSLAKAAWGGLRIGWVRGPGEVIERLARHKVRADLASPVLDQAVAARLLPTITDIAASRSSAMRPRLDHLVRLLTAELPRWRWQLPDGGFALWVELPDTNAQTFAQVALRHGVEIVPGSVTDPTGRHDSYIRVPYTFPIPTLTEMVARLRRAWTELMRHGPTTETLNASR